MMKRYCDVCKKELPDDENATHAEIKKSSAWKNTEIRVSINVKIGKDGNGDLCIDCMLAYLNVAFND